MLKAIFMGLCALACTVALVLAATTALDQPEVHVSWTTGKCIRVVDHDAKAEGRESKWSCDKLPRSYEHIWVR